MTDELVHLDIDGPRATITLDSQHNRNALSRQLVAELFAALEAADATPRCAWCVLQAAGQVFCSGADLSEATADGMEEGARRIVALQRYVVTMSKPVWSELHGAVRAGGIGLVAASDVVIADEDATFALTEVKLGLAAAIISLTVHARMNPRAAALTTLGGEMFSGRGRGVRPGHRGRAGRRPGRAGRTRCAASSPPAHRRVCAQSKVILNRDLVARIDAHGEEMAALSARLFASDEAREAMTAFLNRKK